MDKNTKKRVGQVEQEKTLNNEVENETLNDAEIEVNNDEAKNVNEEEVSTQEEAQKDEEELTSQKFEELQNKLREKEKEYDELKDRLQRTMAEFDNFRKRTIKEKAVLYEDGVRSAIEQILPVIDNFERALSAAQKDDESNSFLQGMEMIYRQFKDILTSMGVEEIKAVGETFDPNLHNAVTHIEDEAFGENEIVEEFQKGYIYKDKVIRYSMVKVAN
ncbi:MAG: molecular chaperone GrpE [Epulopiscium sp.]|mgnify:CR=1 FL=1|jgi:molecular chaperone GrpE|uniref:Protein GrpE n=1 Tax=Defluviitalea raffinosedens TaxID=1450156 RepID=A0A7C8LGX0_9FIRM|nr:nucleotide exchange factor GrpE [Defluviitalea raffinosedens]KAE9637276.1 nucleotide exchange factor GrpE [Defluviitalea raffinosedens]MBZ4668952.1 GrpE protein [Defluviitaleaceae bacterium]MDK2788884.1 molecular chaperone GrpE [Candidatus Epulonipiscium sp.]HHW66692.1 nucleotide exchange factor GrpE [Candidatus Epulonipiscium sp.]